MKKILVALALLIGSTQANAAVDLAVFGTAQNSFSSLGTFSFGFGSTLGIHIGPRWKLEARGVYFAGPSITATGQLNYQVSNIFDLGLQAGIANTSVTIPAVPPLIPVATTITSTQFVFGPHLGFWFGGAKVKFGLDIDYLLTTAFSFNTAALQSSAGLKFML